MGRPAAPLAPPATQEKAQAAPIALIRNLTHLISPKVDHKLRKASNKLRPHNRKLSLEHIHSSSLFQR